MRTSNDTEVLSIKYMYSPSAVKISRFIDTPPGTFINTLCVDIYVKC